MARFMNGPEPFVHPVTGVLVAPFQWYDGFSHREGANEPASEIEEGILDSEDESGEYVPVSDEVTDGAPEGEKALKTRKRKKKDEELGE